MKLKLCNNGLSVAGTNEHGMHISYSIEADEYKQWLTEGNEPEAEFSAEDLEAQRIITLKQAKIKALSNIVVTVGTKGFDGNETARTNMISAILSADLIGKTEETWKLADNTKVLVTLVELRQALALAIQEVGRIVNCTTIGELQ